MTQIIPILRVSEIRRAERFYGGVLGAAVRFSFSEFPDQADPGYRALAFQGQEFHLSSFGGDGAWGNAVYFRVEALDDLWAHISTRAEDKVLLPLTTQPWGQREFHLRDPDGNQLRFGAIAEVHQPRWG